MKKLALTLVFLLLVNVVGVFGVSAELTEPTVYDGTNDAVKAGDNVTVTIEQGTYGKKTGDMVYKVVGRGKDGAAGLKTSGVLGNAVAMAVEFSFMLPTGSAGLAYGTTATKLSDTTYETNGYGAFFKIESGKSFGTSETIENNKWYNVAVQFDCDGGTTATAYLNGECVGTITMLMGGYTLSRNGYIQSLDDDVDTIYLDNVTGYVDTSVATDYSGTKAAKAFDAAEYAASYVTAVSTGWKLDATNKIIKAPRGATLSDLESDITTTNATTDVKRVYNSNFVEIEDENAEIIGSTLVLTANEMTYSYYNIVEYDIDENIKKGDSVDDISFSGTVAKEVESGVYGKTSTDSAYKITQSKTSADKTGVLQSMVSGHRGKDYSTVEFSFAMSDIENSRLHVQPVMFKDLESAASTATGVGIYLSSKGIEVSTGTLQKAYPFKSGQWYNVALQIPTNGGEEIAIYINGEHVYDRTAETGRYGIRYLALNAETNGTVFYVDNINDYTEAFNPERHTPATVAVDNGVVKNGKISMLTGTALSDITSESTYDALRMYDSTGALTENFDDAVTLVFASNNGRDYERTLTYYEKEVKDVIVDYSLTSSTTGEGDEAVTTTKLNSKLLSKTGATLIVAEYTGTGASRQLVSVQTPDAELNDSGVYEIASDEITITAGNTYYIYVWDSLTGLTPLHNGVLVG